MVGVLLCVMLIVNRYVCVLLFCSGQALEEPPPVSILMSSGSGRRKGAKPAAAPSKSKLEAMLEEDKPKRSKQGASHSALS